MNKIAGIALVVFVALSPSVALASAKADNLSASDTINSFLSAIVNWPSIFSFYHDEGDGDDIQQDPEQEQQNEQEPEQDQFIEEFPEKQVEEVPEIFQVN